MTQAWVVVALHGADPIAVFPTIEEAEAYQRQHPLTEIRGPVPVGLHAMVTA